MKVMLAVNANLKKLEYPVHLSAKLDGIRCHIDEVDGKPVALTRANKPIPNKKLREFLSKPELVGLDGELIFGSPTADDVFRATTHKVMTEDEDVDGIVFHVFDYCSELSVAYGYTKRLQLVEATVKRFNNPHIELLPTVAAKSEEELLAFENKCLEEGYEGVIIRANVGGGYKQGRSTVKEGYLLKLKRMEDSEAEVVGVEELMINNNVQERNELGYAKRSTAKDGLVHGGTLGSLRVRWNDVEFSIGSGFDAVTRNELWKIKDELIGCLVKFKYFPVGIKDGVPRFPIFLGIRDDSDM